MEKTVLGHIDCPCCGTVNGVRFTPDKNGKPFGYCEAECGLQLRIGGDRHREKIFAERFPWAAGKPVTVTVPNNPPSGSAPLPVTVPGAGAGSSSQDDPPPKKAERPRTGIGMAVDVLLGGAR